MRILQLVQRSTPELMAGTNGQTDRSNA